MKNTSSKRALQSRAPAPGFKEIYDLFENANRVLQRGSISNSLIGCISLGEHAHESHRHWFLIELVDDLFRAHSFPVNCLPGIDGSSSNHLPLWNINSDRCPSVDAQGSNTIRSALSISAFLLFSSSLLRLFRERRLPGRLGAREKSWQRYDLTLRFVGWIFRPLICFYIPECVQIEEPLSSIRNYCERITETPEISLAR